jgi:hypothetical protein
MKRGERPSLRIVRAIPLFVSFASAVVAAIHTLPATALLTRAASAHPAALFALASHALLALTSLAFFSLGVFHDRSPYEEQGPFADPHSVI